MVSIIIPNYNHAAYLDQRLQTVFNQTYPDYEVIILDDCSTDNSREIIERYRNHPKVSHVIYNETNSGSAFKQWRRGLELAKGEWIWIAESDDYCTKNLLDELLKRATTHKNVVLSYCQSNEVDEKGNGYRTMSWFTDKIDPDYWKKDYHHNGLEEIKKTLWAINSIPNASAVVFKKAAWFNGDKSFERMKMCGDWMLWIQVIKQGNISFCAEPHNYFRTHSLTTRVDDSAEKWKKRLEEEYTIASCVHKFLPAEDRPKLKNKMFSLLRSYCSTHTNAQVRQFILRPASFNSPFPFFKFLAVYFSRKAYSKIKFLFSANPAK